MDPSEVEKLLDAVKAAIQQKSAIKEVADKIKNPVAKAAVQKQVDAAEEVVKKKAWDFAKAFKELPKSEWWKVGKIPPSVKRLLGRLGFDIGEAFGEEAVIKGAAKAGTKAAAKSGSGAGWLLGPFVAAILDILMDPTPIGGVDKRELDSMVIEIEGRCYRVSFFQTKYSDELLWGDIRTEIVEVECPKGRDEKIRP